MKRKLIAALAAVAVCMPVGAYAASLQQQVGDLQNQIDTIKLTPISRGDTGALGAIGAAGAMGATIATDAAVADCPPGAAGAGAAKSRFVIPRAQYYGAHR